MLNLRNATLFRMSPAVAADARRLEEAATDHALRHCGPVEMGTSGFIPPVAGNETLVHRRGNDYLEFAIGREDKMLPGAIVNDAVQQRVREIAEKEGRKVGGRERKRLKEDVLSQLLPVAFIKKSQIHGYLDLANGWVVIDTASRKTAENIVTQLREALGSFPAVPLAPEEGPKVLLTDWLANGSAPALLALGDECELRDYASAAGARWKGRNEDLDSEGVKEHLRGGKQCAQLGLVYDDRVSFVLGEDLTIRKVKLLDIVHEERQSEPEDAEAEALASFTLVAGEVGALLASLQAWFAIPRPSDGDPS